MQLGDFKRHLSPETGIYNIIRDPAERFSEHNGRYLWTWEPFRNLVDEHLEMMRKFTNRPAAETIPTIPGMHPGQMSRVEGGNL